MTLELHVWGPAFSLPSIDPHCLAAICLLTQAVPREQWALVASSDVTVSPTKELPALRNGSVWIGGFRNITHHLSKSSGGRWDLDHAMDGKARADITAFSSFVEAHGQPLVDLSLYVSSENYNSVTRPAHSRVLRWPKPWLLTPQRRTLAKARTEHLNLSALDIDDASSEMKDGTTAKPGSDLIPPSLRSTRQTVTSLVSQPQHASRFRLDAVAEAFFEPLQQLLDQKRFLLSDESPSSLDCLAFAYLALALVPEVPQPWLAESIKARYPDLCRYVRDCIHDFFGGPVRVEDALPGSHLGDSPSLPWRSPEESGTASTAFNLVEAAFESVPIIGQLHKSNILPEPSLAKATVETNRESIQASPPNPILPAVLTIGTIVSGITGYLVYSGLLNLPSGDSRQSGKRRLSDMGEAGAMLGMVDFGDNGSRLGAEDLRAGRFPVGLEVDVAIDQKGAL